MDRDEAITHLLCAATGNGVTLTDPYGTMDAAFPDFDWRLAVGINKVCPECGGKGFDVGEDGNVIATGTILGAAIVYRKSVCKTCGGRGSVGNA